MTGEYGPLPNIQPRALKKVQFDAGEEKETFFKSNDLVLKSNGKLLVYEMAPSFDLKNSPRSQGKVSTLNFFLESCLTLAKDHDPLAYIEIFLYG